MITRLYFPSWFELLIIINDLPKDKCYYQNLCRKTKIAASHIRENIKLLNEYGLLEIQHSSKIKYLVLTEAGKQMALHIIMLRSILWKQENQKSAGKNAIPTTNKNRS